MDQKFCCPVTPSSDRRKAPPASTKGGSLPLENVNGGNPALKLAV